MNLNPATPKNAFKKAKIVISDCHLSAGRFYDGKFNPHEDFHFDDEMVAFLEYFSSGDYGETPEGPVEVELIINGDYFDYLNVPLQGEFEEIVTEDIALKKTEAIIAGHPKVMRALRRFASLPGKKITYLIGNHDADLAFTAVQERITREWSPQGECPSVSVEVIGDRETLHYPEGIEVRHGNQYDAGSDFDFSQPFTQSSDGRQVLNIPWSSFYVMKIVNRLKWEREYLDKIRPIKVFVLFGLLLDPWFTLRFVALSSFYFIQTRLIRGRLTWKKLKGLVEMIGQETKVFVDLESDARRILDHASATQVLVMGHTHRPMHRIYPDGKQYLNSGTWTKMIDLDWRVLNAPFRRTFVLMHVTAENKVQAELRQWVGEVSPHQPFQL